MEAVTWKPFGSEISTGGDKNCYNYQTAKLSQLNQQTD